MYNVRTLNLYMYIYMYSMAVHRMFMERVLLSKMWIFGGHSQTHARLEGVVKLQSY